MNWEASEIVEQESNKFKRWIKESICIRSKTPTDEQGRGSLSAFSHMDTSDLHPQTRGGGGVYKVTLRIYRNN